MSDYGRIELGEVGYIAAPLCDVQALRDSGVILTTERYNTPLKIKHLFPLRDDGLCATGCGEPLTGRQRRWCSYHCSDAANRAYAIIQSMTASIHYYLVLLHGRKCNICKERHGQEVDHIIEIADGGGGLFLDNFQLVCQPCHVTKTTKSRRDRKNRRLGTPELEGLK